MNTECFNDVFTAYYCVSNDILMRLQEKHQSGDKVHQGLKITMSARRLII